LLGFLPMKDMTTPAIYKEIAKKLTTKLIDNLAKTIQQGQLPDLYWKLETSILEALKYADSQGALRAKEQCKRVLDEFNADDGTSQN
jgi:hypothetical protein